VVDDHARPAGRDSAGVQVEVDPAKPGHFSPAHAGGGEQQPGGVQPVISDMVEKDAELLWAPDTHLRRRALGEIGCRCDVAG
jgi:hypothetical protein